MSSTCIGWVGVTMADATRGAQRVSAEDGPVVGVAAAGSGHVDGVCGPVGLPVAVSILVGREQERAEVAELVAETRLVTLTGSGGCGKTRLALEVAHDMAPGFEHGACWVELSGVGRPGSVAQALADAVGLREEPGRALVDTLIAKLRVRHGLVVLDNCEHVVGACATLVGELLRSCPRVTVLATSREPLAIDGETTWQVPPLRVPDPQARSADTVVAADAVALFETRARQVRPDFVVTDDNAAALGEICRRLDGIPLAVELAATRMRVLSPMQIAAGLSDRFRLLTGGGRRAPTRQHTLEASVEWSFGLLSDAERLALARLSVFAGTFDIDAAEAVVAGSDIDEAQVLDLVGALADRSLLQVGEHDGRARYRLLETIRLFAQERLAELDDPARVRDRHLDFFIGLANRAQAGLDGPDAAAWNARLAADLADLRAAMAWAVDSGRPVAVLDIAEPTRRFWFDRSRYSEMVRWLRAAVDSPAATDTDRARGLATASLVIAGSGHTASAYGFADRAVSVARALDVDDTLALGLALRASTGLWSGLATSDTSTADAEQAVALAARLEDDATRILVLAFAGVTACDGRSLREGVELLEQTVAACEDAGVSFTRPTAQAQLGAYLLFSGEFDRAREHTQQGLAWARRIDRPGWEAYALAVLAAADLFVGDIDTAAEHGADAEALLRARSLSPNVFELLIGRWTVLVAYGLGETDKARRAAEALRRAARERGTRLDEAWAMWLLGLVALAEPRPDDAREHLEKCRQLSVDPRYPFTLGRALVGLAGLDGDPEDAWELAHEGLEVLADAGDRLGAVEALEAVAVLCVARDQPDQALRLLAAAERFHDDTGIVRLPVQAERAERHTAAARAQLDPDDAEAYWAEGTQLSLDEAVAYARRGRGERARPQVGWAALTPTEREIVRLVAEGHTNAEIGERVFVSIHTVKKHLSHVYAKVGLDGRAELVAVAARRDL
ncbi:MAG: LuxR C-terminal-related transcriptional regulator [Actinomycetota bacterium]|nr:LuxR C-terminal-related transcriptional regulator [Actinomycetota bacterium]